MFNRNPKLKCLMIFWRLLPLLYVFNIWILLHAVNFPKLLPIVKRLVSLLCSLLFDFCTFNATKGGFWWMWALVLLGSFLYALEGLVRVVSVIIHVDWRLQYELINGDPSLTHTVLWSHLIMLGCRRLWGNSPLHLSRKMKLRLLGNQSLIWLIIPIKDRRRRLRESLV